MREFIQLLLARRFAPLFACQFLGAFNDNLFRSAFTAMLAFGALSQSENSGAMIQLSLALFMLPFFLFSASAGKLADNVGKRPVLLASKIAEAAVMLAATFGVLLQNPQALLLCIFLAGTQSAFFGPVKYSLLPSLLPRSELVSGNILVSASTFVAILAGYAVGIRIGENPETKTVAPLFFLAVAVVAGLGLLAAFQVPKPKDDPAPRKPKFADINPVQATRDIFADAFAQAGIRRHIISLSLFWMLGAVILTELPHFGRESYEALLIAVVCGVCLGGALCRFLIGSRISAIYAPAAAVVAGLFLLDLSAAKIAMDDAGLSAAPRRVFADVIGAAAALTLYAAPIYASLQAASPPQHRARVMAGLNIMNSVFIVGSALVGTAAHVSAPGAATALLFSGFGFAAFYAALFSMSVLPFADLQKIVGGFLRLVFRVRVVGIENLPKRGDPGVVISNHVSLLDAPLLTALLPETMGRPCFAIDPEQAKKPWVRPFLKLVDAEPLNPLEPQSLRRLARTAATPGRRLIIFPEGRITVTGGLMKSYPGAGVLAAKSGDTIAPIHIGGAEFSKLSQMSGKLRTRWLPRITITIFPPRKLTPPANLVGRARRIWLADAIGRTLEENAFRAADKDDNITNLFFRRMKLHGPGAPVFAEPPGRTLTYRTLHRAARALGGVLQKRHRPGENIGVLLPTSVGAAAVFYAAIFRGLTPVMLNVNAGTGALISALRTAQISRVYTARALLERLPALADTAAAMEQETGAEVEYLENLRGEIGLPRKLGALFLSLAPGGLARAGLAGRKSPPDSPACVLFTSGSEGAPKGVVLSHRNLSANCAQILSRLDATPADSMLNALPVFHSFGLTAGVVLPVMSGVLAWQYPSPLHYRLIPEVAYLSNATIFFSADTFLANYGRAAHPSDFGSLRLVFAGAEKLRETTRRAWLNKFGVRILEGYGVTETAPVLAFNAPRQCKAGTVGRMMPGVEAKLVKIEGVESGGRLLVRGPNVMLGYLLPDAPGVLRPPAEGWHDTGDIAELDGWGYLTIAGRVRRFAKIAGEMAPMNGIEERFRERWPDFAFAVVAVSDARRGEVLVLVTDRRGTTREEAADILRAAGMPELWTPRRIVHAESLPQLPTGKPDYPAISELAKSPV